MKTLTFDELNEGQQEGFKTAVDWMEAKESQVILVNARAGRGKTAFLRSFAAETGLNGLITATTNPAARLLGSGASTYHSAFNIRPRKIEGEQIFMQSEEPDLAGVDFIAVDEDSMLTDAGLNIILQAGLPVMLLGDRIQLPPVGEKDPLTGRDREFATCFDMGYPEINFTVPVRNFGEVFQYTEDLADGIDSGKPVANPQKGYGDAVVKWGNSDFRRSLQSPDMLDSFMEGTATAACFTWKQVDLVNSMIRARVFPGERNPFVVGDVLLVKEPIMVPDPTTEKDRMKMKVLFSSNAIGRVLAVEKTFSPYDEELEIWRVSLESDQGTADIYIPTPRGASVLRNKKAALANKAKREKDGRTRSRLWAQFYAYQECHANVAYAMARTVHRLQGSTVPVVYNFVDDLLMRRDLMAYRRLYVAAGRASERVVNVI